MTTATRFASKHTARIFVIAMAVLVAGVLTFPSPASADGRGHAYGHDKRSGHGSMGYRDYPTVPRIIRVERRGDYRPYYTGRAYYAPHHHYHATYRFPVFVGGAMVYRPYAYCGDTLFVSGSVALPHLAFGINFASPSGLSIGGYYGAPAPLLPPVPYAYADPYPYVVEPYPGPGVYYQHRSCDHDD